MQDSFPREALNEAIKAGESTVWALGGKSLLPFPVKQLKDQALEYVPTYLNSAGSIQLIRRLGYSKGIN